MKKWVLPCLVPMCYLVEGIERKGKSDLLGEIEHSCRQYIFESPSKILLKRCLSPKSKAICITHTSIECSRCNGSKPSIAIHFLLYFHHHWSLCVHDGSTAQDSFFIHNSPSIYCCAIKFAENKSRIKTTPTNQQWCSSQLVAKMRKNLQLSCKGKEKLWWKSELIHTVQYRLELWLAYAYVYRLHNEAEVSQWFINHASAAGTRLINHWGMQPRLRCVYIPNLYYDNKLTCCTYLTTWSTTPSRRATQWHRLMPSCRLATPSHKGVPHLIFSGVGPKK